MKFSDIVGHKEAIENLRGMADRDQVPHALLISGPAGIGKMRLARAFAQYIYCSRHVNGDSCGVCPACVQTSELNNPDIHYSYPIRKLKDKFEISADNAPQWAEMLKADSYMDPRKWAEVIDAGNSQPAIHKSEGAEIIRLASVSSIIYKNKVFIIWLPEKMNAETANMLLKLIEEPYEDIKFILVSDDASSVLPTIFSRTQRINLKPLKDEEVAEWLEKERGLSFAEAAHIARLAEGSISMADRIAGGGGEQNEFGDIYRNMMRMAYSRNMSALRSIGDEVAAMGREKAMRFLDYSARMHRENFIYNLRQPSLNVLTQEETDFSSRFAPFVNERNIEDLAKSTDMARRDISRNANAKIVMFDFMINLSRLIRSIKN